MGQLKILHTCSARQYVGEAARVVDAVDFLIQRGHQAEVICRLGYSVASQASRRCLPYTKIHMLNRFTLIYDVLDIRSIRQRIRAFKPDLIHCHQNKDHWLVALALLGMKQKIPLIRTRHRIDKLPDDTATRWLYGRKTQGVICVSTAVRTRVAMSESMLHCPVRTIAGGVNPSHLTPPTTGMVAEFKKRYHISEGVPVVSCLARLVPVKGHEFVLRAIPAIIKRHPTALFLFSFPRKSAYADHLYQLADKLKVRDSVRWIGDLDFLGSFFGVSDIGLVPSIAAEGWSRAATEYLYFGIPVIASDDGCLPQVIQDGVNGYLIDKMDPEAIALKVNALLESPLLVVEMGVAGKTLVQEGLTFNHTVDHLEAFYHEILGK